MLFTKHLLISFSMEKSATVYIYYHLFKLTFDKLVDIRENLGRVVGLKSGRECVTTAKPLLQEKWRPKTLDLDKQLVPV